VPDTPPGAVLKTVLLCDLVDSTSLLERLGDTPAANVFGRHDDLVRSLLEQHHGREVDKSDGFLALFDRPVSAVRFALAYHEGLAQLSAELSLPLLARVGIHLGEVVVRENPPEKVARGAKPLEVEGLAKAVAARVASLARGGQTLLSQGVYDLARRSTVGAGAAEEVRWMPHGKYRLKGVAEPLELFEVGLVGRAPLTRPAGAEKAEPTTPPPAARAGAGRATIVVLPFANLSPDQDIEYLSDGLTDEILTDLSRIKSLGVISRTSAMQFKNTTKDLRTVGRELNVTYALEGGVWKVGRRLRITTKLVDTAIDELIWAEKFDGSVEDVFEIQETISRTVVQALRIQLSAAEAARLAERPIPDVRAYEYYLRARQEIFRFTGEALDRAVEHLSKGLEILGDNVLLQAALGYTYWQYVNGGISGDRAYLAKARECAEQIMQLEPESPHAHRLLGLIGIHGGATADVVRHLRHALDQDPNDTDALLWLSLVLGFAGRAAAARPLVARLLSIDPLTPFYQMLPGFLALMEGDLAGAVEPFRRSAQMDPGNPIVRLTYGQIMAMSGRNEQAYEIFDQLAHDMPDTLFAQLGIFYKLALMGRGRDARALLSEEVRAAAWEDMEYSWCVAQCHAILGDAEEALRWLRNAAVDQNFSNYPLLAERDPLLAPLRKEPAFAQLMAEVRRKWEAVES
jgi:TolB-like protein/class 3 adenylate cyclase/thioredoxin-like negative regulator of GroEL